jgi:hypothetical protein
MSDHLVSRQSPWSAPMTGFSGVSIQVHHWHNDGLAPHNFSTTHVSSDLWAEAVVQSPILGDGPAAIGTSPPTTPLCVGVEKYSGLQRRGSSVVRMEEGNAAEGRGTDLAWKDLVTGQVCLGA